MALETWSTDLLIQWVESNLTTQYHHCLPIIKEHDIDGKLLKECLGDRDAKSSLLVVLFPDAKDAFLRLSFMRKIEKIETQSDSPTVSNGVSGHTSQSSSPGSTTSHSSPSPITESKQKESQSASTNVENIQTISENGIVDSATNDCKQCYYCGAVVSAFMLDNHLRHCLKQKQVDEEEEEEEEETAMKNNGDTDHQNKEDDSWPPLQPIDDSMIAGIEENIEVECEFCGIPFNITLIDDHSLYCGSRTELCPKCGLRDTLKRFKYNQHQCYPVNSYGNSDSNNSSTNSIINVNVGNVVSPPSIPSTTSIPSISPRTNHSENGHIINPLRVVQNGEDISFQNTSLDITNQTTASLIPSFERQLFDLQKILHDRFVVDYNNTATHFKERDHFGNERNPKYRQKQNRQISTFRTLYPSAALSHGSDSMSKISNESRSKYESTGKSKEELKREYNLKLKAILSILLKIIAKIIEDPMNRKYRVLKCSNPKLAELLFPFSPCCEFLKLCGFEYFDRDFNVLKAPNAACYRMKVADAAKLKVAMGVIKYVQIAFENQEKVEEYNQEQWERKQAYVENEKSLLHGAWSCKRCNHLNRKTSICRKCKYKKRHSPKKEKKKRMEVPLSVERWICRECGNRNAVELNRCDNCKKEKVVADRSMIMLQQRSQLLSVDLNCKWKWENNDGGFEEYEPDISNIVEALRVGESTVVMDQYSIKKVANELAIQRRLSSGHERDVKRFGLSQDDHRGMEQDEDDLYLDQDEWM